MAEDERIKDARAIALPHLHVGSGYAGGFDGEPAPCLDRPNRQLVTGEPAGLDQQHGFGDIRRFHHRRV
jgi:hypothetical protein